MKILTSGDWHLDCFKIGKIDSETDLDLRVKDFFDAVDRMIDYAIENKVDIFIVNGDLFKGRTSTHLIETLIAARFKKIASHMELIINLGNHDYTPKQLSYGIHTYSILEKFGIHNCKIITEMTHLTYDDFDLFLYPYYDLKRVSFTSNDQLISWIESTIDQTDFTKPTTVFVGHGTPEGTLFNEDFLISLDLIAEPVLPKQMLEQFDIALFSHIHRNHSIGDKIHHIGSPERVDFAEADHPKKFAIYDTKTKQLTWESTNPRPMKDIKLDLMDMSDFDDPTQVIIDHLLKIKDLDKTMIKLSIKIPEQNYSQVNHNEIRAVLSKAFWSKAPIWEVPKTQQARIKGLTEQLTEHEALEKILETKADLSDNDKQQILIKARGLLAQCN